MREPRTTGIRLLILLAIAVSLLGGRSILTPASGQGTSRVYLVELDMTIDAGAEDLVSRGIAQADRDPQASAVVIRINTNGGYLIATENIVDSIKLSTRPVTVFVGPRAARAFSAGAYIAMAADTIAMAPQTVIGAATPVPSDAKAVSAFAAWMRALAEGTGRNATVAERFVTESLTLTAGQAKTAGIAELIVEDVPELLGELGLEGSEVVLVGGDLRSDILSFASNPTMIWILLIGGFLLILLGLFHPTFVGEAAGVAFVVLGLFGLGILSVNPVVIALVIIGAATIFLELKAGNGLLAISGVVISLVGIALVYQGEPLITPQVSEYAIAVAGLTGAGFVGFYLRKIREVLSLRSAAHDIRRLRGRMGVVKSGIRPGGVGVVLVASDLWTAVSDEEINEGERVRVVGTEGIKLRVERVDEDGN